MPSAFTYSPSNVLISAWMRRLVLSLATCVSTHVATSAPHSADSEQFLRILSNVKAEAVGLDQDSAELSSFTRSNLSWQTHADKVNQIRAHVNQAGSIVRQLNDMRIAASPWQRIAIDRINLPLQELASGTEKLIREFDAHPERIHMKVYTDYVNAQYELADQLTVMIGDFVEYGRLKAKLEEISDKLELSDQ
jgi:UDP-N-acetylglucosamine enolpyruvyl transferase